MKIAYIATTAANDQLKKLANSIVQTEHEVFLCLPNNFHSEKFGEQKNLHLITFPKWLPTNLYYFLAVVCVMFIGCDVIDFQMLSFCSWLPRIFSSNTLVVATLSEKLEQVISVRQRLGLLAAQQIFTNSKQNFAKLQKDFADKTILLTKHGVVSIAEKTNLLTNWNLKDRRYLLTTCQLSKESDLHYLIEAFKQLEDSAKMPNNFKLVLEGEIVDEQYYNYLQTISSKRRNIIFVGQQDGKTVQQLFSHAYLFVQTSNNQAEQNLLRAMNYGLATLANANEQMPFSCEGGYSFKAKSIEHLRDKLAYLINRGEEVTKAGELARQTILAQFSWQSIAQRKLDAYCQRKQELLLNNSCQSKKIA